MFVVVGEQWWWMTSGRGQMSALARVLRKITVIDERLQELGLWLLPHDALQPEPEPHD